jgi:hypothetical protein
LISPFIGDIDSKKGRLSTVVIGWNGAKRTSTAELVLGADLSSHGELKIGHFLKGIGHLASSLLYLTLSEKEQTKKR